MQIGQTNLQEQRQNEQTANNMLAAAPASINPNNANVDPWQGVRDSANEYIKTSRTVTPPSEGEIHKRMWESSMMTGLIITLATGNVAGGLAAGMWGAVAVHDYGYTLRQRAEHVPQLQAEGYSMPAILKWYEDGDNSELDKERMEKEKVREFDLGRQDRNEQFRESQDEKVREFNAGQQLSREQMGQQMAIAQMHEAGANARAVMAAENARATADRAERRAEQADQRASNQEVSKQIAPQQAKLAYLHAADADLTNLENALAKGDEAAAGMAYNSYIEHKAKGMQGGNASMTKGEMEHMVGLPKWEDSELQKWHLLGSGTPTKTWMKAQRAGTANDLHTEEKVLHDGAVSHYYSLLAGGYEPEQASRMTNNSYSGTGLSGLDYTKLPAPNDGKTVEKIVDKTPEQPKEKPSSTQVDNVMAKYGHQTK